MIECAAILSEQIMAFTHIRIPAGEKISVNQDYSLNVPNHPVIPFIEGDGIGRDITPVMRKVVDAAVAGCRQRPSRRSGNMLFRSRGR
jgi:hypothetical protein